MQDGVLHIVEGLHRRIVRLERLHVLSRLAVAMSATLAAAVGVDALIRWPWWIRLALLAGGLVWAVRSGRRAVERGWTRAPGAGSVAVRLEKVEPRLAGLLASAFDFERSGEALRSPLAARVVQQAAHQVTTLQAWRHVRTGRPLGMAAVAMLALLAWVVAALLQPEQVRVGLCRTLTPWTGDQWPARVALQVSVPPKAVARGSTIELQATVTRGDQPNLRVRADCEVNGSVQGERSFDLVRQPDGSFSRPITAEGDRMTIRLAAGDAEPEPIEVVVRTPPAITRGEIDITPPAYATRERPALRSAWQGVAVNDAGLVLAGSQATVQLELATDAADPQAQADMVLVRADGSGDTVPCKVSRSDARHWSITFPVDQPSQLQVLPRDAEGVSAIEPLRLALRVVNDSEPTVSIVEPESDENVTAEAMVPFRVEARDDISLSSVGWRVDRQQRSGEPAPVVLAQGRRESSRPEERLQDSLSVASVQAKVGDVLQLRGVASDHFEKAGVTRAEVRSEPRRLRVIEREAFERQARQQAGTIREAAARLAGAQQDIERDHDAGAAARAQAGLAERVHDTTQSAQRLLQRLKRNGLQENALSDALREAGDLGTQAERQARQAQEALVQSAAGNTSAQAKAQEAQREAQAALQRMVDVLDRDDDAAGAQRRADRLAEGIRQLREDLRKASRGSAGKAAEDLTPQERQAMQEQAARQRTAAEEAAAMIDDLRARADRAQSKDRAQAASLRQAADEGERGQASRRMDEAADRTDRNQAAAADEAMQAAAEAVDRVRGALREDRRARTEDLKRRLASLADTLKALITQAEASGRQVHALAATPSKPVDETATALVRLSRNTAGAAEEARQSGGAAQKAFGSITRAGGTFDSALVALRASPVQFDSAHDDLARGTDLLREALKAVQQAQREQQAKQAEQERAQLAKQYRQLAIDTRAVRQAVASTVPADGSRIDRRGAATQRDQAVRVDGIQRSFADGPCKAEALKAAQVFKAMHERLTRDLASIHGALEAAQAGAGTVRQLDIAADGFDALAMVLTDPQAPEDPFADAKQQQGEGEQAGMGEGAGDQPPALPPITELRLVRQMQQQVNSLTTALQAAREAGQPVDPEMQDLATMQEEVRRLGEEWFERMKGGAASKRAPKGASPDTTKPAPPSMGLHFPWQGSAPSTQATPPSQASPDAGASPATTPPKTLDELLGIGGGTSDAAAEAQRKRKLERSLKEEDLNDLAKAATESMQVATGLVRDQKDTGLGTQRVQAEALANLDALIEAATRFQKQQQASKSSSSKQQSGKPQKGQQDGKQQESQQSGGDQEPKPQPGKGEKQSASQDGGRNRDGTQGDQVEPPPAGDEAASGALLEGRSEWGHLPRRVREIMSQARRDPVSAMYQQATEAYYRRMAEDRKP